MAFVVPEAHLHDVQGHGHPSRAQRCQDLGAFRARRSVLL
jgi:hypothetical protein